jgi:hypothetical protein
MMQQRIRSSETAYSNEYAFAPFPNSRCGFRFARSKMVCAKTEFAQANQLPRQLLANTKHNSNAKHTSKVALMFDVNTLMN